MDVRSSDILFLQNYKYFSYFCIFLHHLLMARHNDTGSQGEALAQQYMVSQGYAILATNWKLGKLEADIIAYKEGLVVFVEVKTRSSLDYGDPEEFVSRAKQRGYIRMANAYMIQNDREEEVRFDIISIEMTPSSYRLDHIPDAFSAIGQHLR